MTDSETTKSSAALLHPVESGGIPARVLRAEWSGSQQVLWLESEAGLLRMLWPVNSVAPERLQVGWAPEEALAFEERSGERVPRCEPSWSRDLIKSLEE